MKKILKIIVGIIFVLVVLPAFLSSKFQMARSIEIDAPITTVFSKLTRLSEYNKWNPFPEGDPTNQTQITGEGVGSFLTWQGNKTGEGKMTIVEIDSNKKIIIKMEFYKPMSSEGTIQWVLNSKNNAVTEMIWTFEQDLTYFNRYFGLFMETMMGKHFEKGLISFKKIVEFSK